MGWFGAVGILTVLHHLLDVLIHFSAQGYRQGLDASADAEHRYLTVESQTDKHQLCSITLLIDIVKTGRRLLAHPQRVMVASTRQDQTI